MGSKKEREKERKREREREKRRGQFVFNFLYVYLLHLVIFLEKGGKVNGTLLVTPLNLFKLDYMENQRSRRSLNENLK